MIKHILLATTMCIAVPAFAQETTTPDTQTEPVKPASDPVAAEESTTPADPVPAVTPAPTDTVAAPQPVQSDQALPAPAAPTQPVAEATPAPAPAGEPANRADQVAQIVNAEFGTYDRNGDGSLDQAEFSTWIGALRVRAEPSFAADSTEGKAWLTAAFTAADADKNAGVNATELTSFLTPKPAA